MKKQKEVNTVCLYCGERFKTKNKTIFGTWIGNCDMCGKVEIPVADAAHDFGIYSSKKKVKDRVDDLI